MTCSLLQSLHAEFNRFRVDEMPPKFEEKKRLMQLYDELKVGNTIILYHT